MIRFLAMAICCGSVAAADPLILQSTTSTQNAGLYDAILPDFTDKTGITVHVVAVGTGQAIKNAQNCDADLLLVHATAAEEAFVAAGYGLARNDVMYNDFVFVGPADDPAGIKHTSATDALQKIAEAKHPIVSRGDNSGTHQAELALWANAGLSPVSDARWYLETGAGMGATLNTAVGLGAYVMTDRATWVRFANKGDFAILVEGDPLLFNQYGVVTINPDHCPNANHSDAVTLRDWLLGPNGQTAIAAYQIEGQQLFNPNASP